LTSVVRSPQRLAQLISSIHKPHRVRWPCAPSIRVENGTAVEQLRRRSRTTVAAPGLAMFVAECATTLPGPGVRSNRTSPPADVGRTALWLHHTRHSAAHTAPPAECATGEDVPADVALSRQCATVNINMTPLRPRIRSRQLVSNDPIRARRFHNIGRGCCAAQSSRAAPNPTSAVHLQGARCFGLWHCGGRWILSTSSVSVLLWRV
jgi:hypothetical protein